MNVKKAKKLLLENGYTKAELDRLTGWNIKEMAKNLKED